MTAFFALIPKWVWAAFAATLAATSCKLTIDLGSIKLELEKTKLALAEQEAAYESARANTAEIIAEAQQRAREAEQSMTVAIAEERKRANDAQVALNRRADELLARVREYQASAARASSPYALGIVAARPSAFAAAPKAAIRRDSSLILGTLGEEDVREAQRADLIREELLGCYRSYDRAQEVINSLSVSNPAPKIDPP